MNRMLRADCYPASLPAEFSPPDRAAERIVALPTRAEREAFWLRVPEAWRPSIGRLAALHLGMAISEMPELERRRQALGEVPEIWLEDVRWHVRRLYNTREIRAEFNAERDQDRGRALAKGRW